MLLIGSILFIPLIAKIFADKGNRGWRHVIANISSIFTNISGIALTVGIIDKIYSLGSLFALITCLSPFSWLILARFKKNGAIDIIARSIDHKNKLIRSKSASSSAVIKHNGSGNHVHRREMYFITKISSGILSICIIAAQFIVMSDVIKYQFSYEKYLAIMIAIILVSSYLLLGSFSANMKYRISCFTFMFFVLITISICSIAFANTDLKNLYSAINQRSPAYIPIVFWIGLAFINLMPSFSPTMVQKIKEVRFSASNRIFQDVSILHIIFTFIVVMVGMLSKSSDETVCDNFAFLHFISHFSDKTICSIISCCIMLLCMEVISSMLQGMRKAFINENGGLKKYQIKRLSARSRLKMISSRHRYNFKLYLNNILLLYGAEAYIGSMILLSIVIAALFTDVLDILWFGHTVWRPIATIYLTSALLGVPLSAKSIRYSVGLAIVGAAYGTYLFAYIFSPISVLLAILGSAIPVLSKKFLRMVRGIRTTVSSSGSDYTNFYGNLNQYCYAFSMFCMANYLLPPPPCSFMVMI